MLSIQELGTSILGDNPKSFYILGGSEYGVKKKYIDILVNKIGKLTEYPDMDSLLRLLNKKQLIPLQPSVYIVRYDEAFVSAVSDKSASVLKGLKFSGVIICLYEQVKHIIKLDKYFPENTAAVDNVSPQFLSKYLHSDFPKLPDRFIDIAVNNSDNYCQAQNICRCMSFAPLEELFNLEDSEILKIFGLADSSTEAQIRAGVASRNFKYLTELIDNYDNVDSVLYTILQTMIELDKLKDNKYAQSDIRDYAKYWTREDIYYMFNNTYSQLKKSRSSGAIDNKLVLTYLFALLKYTKIPAPEVMN